MIISLPLYLLFLINTPCRNYSMNNAPDKDDMNVNNDKGEQV